MILIDKHELLSILDKNSIFSKITNSAGKSVIDIINEMPDRLNPIIENLKNELSLADIEKRRAAVENPMQFDRAVGYANGIANALDFINEELPK